MSDIFPIRQAEKLGYIVFWRYDKAWFSFQEHGKEYVNGPYQTLEDAAYAALADAEKMQDIQRERAAWENAW